MRILNTRFDFIFSTLLGISFLTSCATTLSESESVSVLTYNVETLFDSKHDRSQGKDKLDYTYLPLEVKRGALRKEVTAYCSKIQRADWKKECLNLDWTHSLLKEKMSRIGQIIRQSTTGCPDIVILQEIENESVLKELRDTELQDCNYSTAVLSDDRDVRGIDIAILSKFELLDSKTLEIPFSDISETQLKDTRGILDATLLAKGTRLRVLGVHLPAPFHPKSFRNDAVAYFQKTYLEKNAPTIIAGDWNIPVTEEPGLPAVAELRKNFIFSDDSIRSATVDRGSTYYAKEQSWSFLDKIVFGRNHFLTIECRLAKVIPQQLDSEGRPQGFDSSKAEITGVSDHLPILCRSAL